MKYKLKITCGLKDSARNVTPNDYLPNDYFPNGFIPRIGDTIVWLDCFWDVKSIVIDYFYKEIRIWVKDSEHFK